MSEITSGRPSVATRSAAQAQLPGSYKNVWCMERKNALISCWYFQAFFHFSHIHGISIRLQVLLFPLPFLLSVFYNTFPVNNLAGILGRYTATTTTDRLNCSKYSAFACRRKSWRIVGADWIIAWAHLSSLVPSPKSARPYDGVIIIRLSAANRAVNHGGHCAITAPSLRRKRRAQQCITQSSATVSLFSVFSSKQEATIARDLFFISNRNYAFILYILIIFHTLTKQDITKKVSILNPEKTQQKMARK